jgi:hypothetical protein
MRARIHLSFLLSCSLVLLLASFSSVQAQIHGTPPSVTSFGFGGSNNPAPGVAASVTSLGPNGFSNGFGNCCFGPFFSSRPPLAIDGRLLHHHHQFPGIIMPVYVPYAVPYPVPYDDTGDDQSVNFDATQSRDVPVVYDRSPRYRDASAPRKALQTTPEPTPAAPSPLVPAALPEPVAAQPGTVLIFKDGHQSEVQNYAIFEETLFDFTDGRSHRILLADLDLPATQKANDDRGVDFQIPAKTAQVNQEKVKH